MSDAVVTARERALIAQRLARWPSEWREHCFSSLPPDERATVALLVLELDARPEGVTLVEPPAPAPESLFDETAGDAQRERLGRERPEPTYPEWWKSKPGQPRELPDVALAFMREHGLRP